MICIYTPTNTDYTKNGDAVLTPTSCALSMTLNGAWQLTLEHPYDPEGRYKYITEGAVIRAEIKCIRELTSTAQRFRVYNIKKGLQSITAIAFPIAMEANFDAPIDNLVITGKTGIQAMAQLQTKTQKYTLQTDITKTGSSSFSNTNISSAIASGSDNAFISVWGGEIIYDNLKFFVKGSVGDGTAANHKITYGHNLTAIEYNKDDSGLTTRIYPISKDGIRLNGTGYVDSSRAGDYPLIHARYIQAPYNLIEDDIASATATATMTAQAKSAVGTQASTLSHSTYNNYIKGNYEPAYIKSIKSEIISAVQSMALADVFHAGLKSLFEKTIADNMAWLSDLEQPEWGWMEVQADGWKYGNADGYAKSQYLYIDKKWRYFNSQGFWERPKDDADAWDWYQPTGSSARKYGNFTKYYAHNTYVYITVNGQMKEYWFNSEGWYEDDESGDSDYTWQGSGTSADPWWFGDSGSTGKYLKDGWWFIDGTYYYFDSNGYYDGSTKRDNYQWDWNDGGSADRSWFGNPNNEAYAAVYLTSQWAKINGTWIYFDANGNAELSNTSQARAVGVFTTQMAGLKTTANTWKTNLYNLLYQLMTAYCNKLFASGYDLPSITITVNMADLSKTTEYQNFEDLETVKLGDAVKCKDQVHNITVENRVIGLTYDCIRDYNSSVTIGKAAATVSQMIGGSSSGEVAGGFDTSVIENTLTTHTNEIGALQQGKQDKLQAGTGIDITNNVISATGGGGGGLQYWTETADRIERSVQKPVEGGWTANSNYLRTDQAVFKYGNRTYKRTHYGDGHKAVCGWAIVNTNAAWYQPLYLSTDPDDVEFVENDINLETYSGTLTWSGLTFYTAGTGMMEHYYPGLEVDTELLYLGRFDRQSGETDRECLLRAYAELIRVSNLRTTDSFRTGISVKDDYCFFGGYSVEEEPEIIDLPFWVDSIGRVNATDFLLEGISILQRYIQDVKINGTSIVSDQIANLVDFTGATGSSTGEPGLVPAPAANSNLEFLCSNGAWKYVVRGVTGDEYDALPATKYTDNVMYLILQLAQIFGNAATISLESPNGITLESSQVSQNIGTLSAYEYSAGHEGFNLAINNLTIGTEYTLRFDFQFTDAAFIGTDYRTGYKIADSIKSDYSDYTQWPENLARDEEKHSHSVTFTATKATMYLAFELDGCSDGQNNYFTISNMRAYPSAGNGTLIYNGLSYGGEGAVMTGATASADGRSGAVPKPTTADVNKFLKGDGTWAAIGETETDIFSIFDTTNINDQYSSGTLGGGKFEFSVDENVGWWSASATAYNDTAIDLTNIDTLRIKITITDQADFGFFWVTFSQTKYTWGGSSWPGIYYNEDSTLKISEGGVYDIDVSSLTGNYYIYIGATTGKASETHGDCDNSKNGKITGSVTGFYTVKEGETPLPLIVQNGKLCIIYET